VRIAGVYGPNWSDPGHEQTEAGIGFGWLPNYFVYRLSRGQPVAVWTDYVNILANPSLASDVANALLDIALEGHRGLFHCAGRDSISRLDLARAVAQVFGYDPELVRATTPEEMDPGILQGKLTAPCDCRLSVVATEDRVGRVNLGVHAGLEEYRRQLEVIGKGVI
jgi:dTDP-4-dehydrorhamnose reductase